MTAPARVLGVALAAVLLLGAAPERAFAVWQTHGPDGGEITALAVEPAAPSHVYAGTPFDGVFRSLDGGVTWQPANTGLTNHVIYSLVADPLTASGVAAPLTASGVAAAPPARCASTSSRTLGATSPPK